MKQIFAAFFSSALFFAVAVAVENKTSRSFENKKERGSR
jgi:hypothetical protein